MSKGLKISSRLKNHILSEALKAGCNISDLAKSHGITPKTVYNWRRAYYHLASDQAKTQAPQTQDETKSQTEPGLGQQVHRKGNDFVELLVGDTHTYNNNMQTRTLQRTSLLFSNLSLSLEGAVKSSSLFAIIKILEEESC